MFDNTPSAADLAAKFNVAELEPRLENAWSDMSGDTSGIGHENDYDPNKG